MNEAGKSSWLKSLKDAPAKWRRRSRTERMLLLEASVLLGAARLGVLILPFRWLAKSLGQHMKETDESIQPGDLHLARMIGWAVRSGANYTPWESVCLPQAVAAKWMIKRRSIPGTLYLGVMKDETKPEKLAAHAWVKCGQVILTGAKGHRQYTVVSTFS
ncbi:MAG: lasso peptide biosynthesis B2 protein [Smithellaceae bacterium]|nr:lasso peptide biosynthesis B2 protein [Smithellaceae bacterium]